MAWRNGGRRQTGVLLAVALVIGVLSACQPRLDQPAPGQAWEVQQLRARALRGARRQAFSRCRSLTRRGPRVEPDEAGGTRGDRPVGGRDGPRADGERMR